jgi:hypothetical protein
MLERMSAQKENVYSSKLVCFLSVSGLRWPWLFDLCQVCDWWIVIELIPNKFCEIRFLIENLSKSEKFVGQVHVKIYLPRGNWTEKNIFWPWAKQIPVTKFLLSLLSINTCHIKQCSFSVKIAFYASYVHVHLLNIWNKFSLTHTSTLDLISRKSITKFIQDGFSCVVAIWTFHVM